jgi:hypothetical protein
MSSSFRWIRYGHLAASPFVGAFVYSPALREHPVFAPLVQAVVFPLVAVLGLWLWLGPRWLARRAAAARALQRQEVHR